MRPYFGFALAFLLTGVFVGCQGGSGHMQLSSTSHERVYIQSLNEEELLTQLEACPDNPDGETECLIICHVPPGHPEKAKTLAIPQAAIEAHLNHGSPPANPHRGDAEGDYLGFCGEPAGDDGDSSDGDNDSGTDGGDSGDGTDSGSGGYDSEEPDDPTYCNPTSLYDLDCDGFHDQTGEPL